MNDELKDNKLNFGYNPLILDELVRVMKKINIYVWCNGKQIPMYFNFFVNKHKCNFEIIIWEKTNATPLFNNKYLTDKEYCLYFRKGAYCNPRDYETARTVYQYPINTKDKNEWQHPTIKPLHIVKNLVENSSKPGDVVLDCFMGSGTTGIACNILGREFIGIENNEEYFKIAEQRIETELAQIRWEV